VPVWTTVRHFFKYFQLTSDHRQQVEGSLMSLFRHLYSTVLLKETQMIEWVFSESWNKVHSYTYGPTISEYRLYFVPKPDTCSNNDLTEYFDKWTLVIRWSFEFRFWLRGVQSLSYKFSFTALAWKLTVLPTAWINCSSRTQLNCSLHLHLQ
jgi:hypothetical protein